MKYILFTILLLFFTTTMEAFSVRSIRVQTLLTDTQAQKALLKFEAFAKTQSNILDLQKKWNFEFKVIELGKYHVITIEPLTQEDVVKELLDTVHIKYEDAYAKKIKLTSVVNIEPILPVIIKPEALQEVQITNAEVVPPPQPVEVLVEDVQISDERVVDEPKEDTLQTIDASSYDEGIKAYKSKDYQSAIEFFKASKEEYANVDMQLLWAKSEEALGRTDSAIAAYERVVELEPKNLETTIKLIEFYKKDGQGEEATQIAKNFDDKDLTPEQRTALSALLSVSYEKLDKFSGLVSLKLGYDSNIASTPDAENLDAFASNLSLTKAQRDSLSDIKATGYSQLLASFSYLHDLKDVGGWFVKADVTGIAQLNFSESLYNTKYIQVSGAVGYKILNTTITLPLLYDFTAYLDNDLLQNYTIAPTISTLIASNYIFDFSLKASQKRYIPQNMSSDYDADSYGALASLYYIFGGSYVVGKISYDKSEALNENRQLFPPKYVDYAVISTSLATKYRIIYDYILDADYKLKIRNYDEKLYLRDSNNIYSWGNDKRKDIYQSIGIGFSKDIFTSAKVTSKYRYSNNSSNCEIADYNKHNISMGIEYSF